MTLYDSLSMLFTVDEKIILNRSAVGVSLQEFCNLLSFFLAVVTDEDMCQCLTVLNDKVNSFDEEKWDALQSFLPFDVPFAEEDLLDLQEEE